MRWNVEVKFMRYLAEFVWYFLFFALPVVPGKLKPLTRGAGSKELWSLLALVVIKTCLLELTYVSLYCLLFIKERKCRNSENGNHWYDQANVRRDWNSRGANVIQQWWWQRDKNFNFGYFRLKWWQHIWNLRSTYGLPDWFSYFVVET